jgi:hypothetical protein
MSRAVVATRAAVSRRVYVNVLVTSSSCVAPQSVE